MLVLQYKTNNAFNFSQLDYLVFYRRCKVMYFKYNKAYFCPQTETNRTGVSSFRPMQWESTTLGRVVDVVIFLRVV